MNKTIISGFLAVGMIAVLSFKPSQQDIRGTARVQIMQGKHIYVASEPLQPYDVVFDFSSTSVGMGCPGIYDQITSAIDKATKDGSKKNIQFDAIIVGSGKRDIAIRYK